MFLAETSDNFAGRACERLLSMPDNQLTELSLGHRAELSDDYRAKNKIAREISLVRKGAHQGCHLLGMTSHKKSAIGLYEGQNNEEVTVQATRRATPTMTTEQQKTNATESVETLMRRLAEVEEQKRQREEELAAERTKNQQYSSMEKARNKRVHDTLLEFMNEIYDQNQTPPPENLKPAIEQIQPSDKMVREREST